MKFRKTLLAAGVLLSLSTVTAEAALTVSANALGVYDSGIKATWTQDANLLGTMEANPTAYGYANTSSLITAIISASGGVIHDTPNYYDGSYNNSDGANGRAYSGAYTLSASDFAIGGTVDWWAAQAYVSYLNSLNHGEGYGGSNKWALPTTVDSSTSQLAELYYSELNDLGYPGTNGSNFGILGTGTYNDTSGTIGPFSNAHTYVYWSGTESASVPAIVWRFNTNTGSQSTITRDYWLYAWAVSPGQLPAVPVPGAVWLFGTGMLGLLSLKRRGHAG